MKRLKWILATTLLPFLLQAEDATFWGFDATAKAPFFGEIWKADLPGFSEQAYNAQVAILLETFEKTTGKLLHPGPQKRAALKIYSDSGNGLNTPMNLVRAVISELERRGFHRDNLSIVDARTDMLRDSGFLPPLSRMQLQGPYFEGVRVYALDRQEQKSSLWYYESPLPQEFSTPLGRAILGNVLELDPVESRKSYLPENLLTKVDFWINLPVAAHHPATGLSGALLNASLWNITNGTRFLNSPANAPVAVAEIASIPELQAGWALNLISLEHYQFIAGPAFNANYTESQPQLWMSVDPVIMDMNLIQIMNTARRARGFTPLPLVPEFIEYSMDLGLGTGSPSGSRNQGLSSN